MEKFYLKNGKEVQLGDIISKSSKVKHPLFGDVVITDKILVTEAIISKLLEDGIISKSSKENNLTLSYYIKKLSGRLGWKPEKMANYLNTINNVYPAAAFSMVLKEIAIELDKKYEGHIEDSPEIYVISMLDGRITKANKAHIKSYKNFAAFRSIEDAKFACSVVREILKEMFKSGK